MRRGGFRLARRDSVVNSAVARIEGQEHPFGLLDEPFFAPVPVFRFELRQLEIESATVFQVARWRAVRFAAQLSSQGFQRQCQPGLTGGLLIVPAR